MASLFLVASLQAFFLAALLASKRGRTLADGVLGLWLALLGGHTLVHHLRAVGVSVPALVLNLSAGFPFVQGPFLFAYVDTLTRRRPRLRAGYLPHLLPLLAFLAWVLILATPGPEEGTGGVAARHVFAMPWPLTAWLLLAVPAYVAWSILRIRAFRRELEQTLSSVDRIDLGWLRFLGLALGFVWIVVLGSFLAARLRDAPAATAPTHLVFVAVALFVYALGFFGLRQRAVFGGLSTLETEAPDPPTATGSPGKYARSGLTEDLVEQLHRRLLALMDAEKPYLDERLTLQDLAQRLRVSPNHLSQVVNAAAGQSFFAFVNRYRVRAVEEKLRDPAHRDASLLDVAVSCGFGSKSVFNRIFKETTGMTPGRYRQAVRQGERASKESGSA